MARPKKIKIMGDVQSPVIEETKVIEEKRNFSVIMIATKKPAIIKKSEYNNLIHIAI
jgi:hypothetical protein